VDRRDDSRADIDQARSVCRRLKLIFEPGGTTVGTLDEAQRLCEIGRVAVDDLYCQNVMRAVGACAQHSYRTQPDDTSLRPLIQSLLAAFDSQLDALDDPHHAAPACRYLDRRRAQRRNYLIRPASIPSWRSAHHISRS
jgi:hypothetical protein